MFPFLLEKDPLVRTTASASSQHFFPITLHPHRVFSQYLPWLQIFALLAFFLMASCASDPKRPSPVTTEVGEVREILRELTRAYERKTTDDFLAKLDSTSKLRQSLEQGIAEDFTRFSEVTLSIGIERIEIEEKRLLMAVRWKGIWKTNTASPLEKQGKALLIWAPRKDPKLLEIRGSSPFVIFPE